MVAMAIRVCQWSTVPQITASMSLRSSSLRKSWYPSASGKSFRALSRCRSSTSQTATILPKRWALRASPRPCPPQPISARRTVSLGDDGAGGPPAADWAAHCSTNQPGNDAPAVTMPAAFKKSRRVESEPEPAMTISSFSMPHCKRAVMGPSYNRSITTSSMAPTTSVPAGYLRRSPFVSYCCPSRERSGRRPRLAARSWMTCPDL